MIRKILKAILIEKIIKAIVNRKSRKNDPRV
jgi:hypothetical protein